MTSNLETVSGLYKWGRYLLAEAPSVGAELTQQVLGRFFSTPWSSNLEALAEFKQALHAVNADVERHFPLEARSVMATALQNVDQAVYFWHTNTQSRRSSPDSIR